MNSTGGIGPYETTPGVGIRPTPPAPNWAREFTDKAAAVTGGRSKAGALSASTGRSKPGAFWILTAPINSPSWEPEVQDGFHTKSGCFGRLLPPGEYHPMAAMRIRGHAALTGVGAQVEEPRKAKKNQRRRCAQLRKPMFTADSPSSPGSPLQLEPCGNVPAVPGNCVALGTLAERQALDEIV